MLPITNDPVPKLMVLGDYSAMQCFTFRLSRTWCFVYHDKTNNPLQFDIHLIWWGGGYLQVPGQNLPRCISHIQILSSPLTSTHSISIWNVFILLQELLGVMHAYLLLAKAIDQLQIHSKTHSKSNMISHTIFYGTCKYPTSVQFVGRPDLRADVFTGRGSIYKDIHWYWSKKVCSV